MKKIFFLIIFIVAYPVFSQMSLELKQFSSDSNLDISEFPTVKAHIKAFDGLNVTDVNSDEMLILEEGYTIEPYEIEDTGEWQIVKWKTKRTIFDLTDLYYASRIYWSKDNQVVYSNAYTYYNEFPVIKVTENDEQFTDISYGNVAPGNSIPFVFKIQGYLKNPFEEGEKPMHIDSITNQSDAYTIEWMGSDRDPDNSPPPRLISPDYKYWVKVIFSPPDTEPYFDKIVIHYNGGFRKVIPLKGNSLKLESETILKLLEPNGGEIFTPCEDVEIKWEGYSTVNPVKIEYSDDGGNSWNPIDEVWRKSSYMWKVPSTISDNVKIRISQEFKETETYGLYEEDDIVVNAGYYSDATKAVTISENGKVLEWSFEEDANPSVITKANVVNFGNDNIYSSNGIQYLSEDEFTVLYRDESVPYFQIGDTLAYFRTGEDKPYKKVRLSDDLRIQKLISEYSYEKYYAIPELGTQVLVIAPETGETERTIDFTYPVIDISISRDDELAVLLMNNELIYINTNNYQQIKTIKYPDLRMIQAAEISQNGKYTAVAELQVQSGQPYSSYLVDKNTEMLARQFTPAASPVVGFGFNLTSNTLALGSTHQPQISIYDLSGQQSTVNLQSVGSTLLDMILSPIGKSMITLARDVRKNATFRTFTYPETDISDNEFRIVAPKITDEVISFDADYLGHETIHIITSIENEGEKFLDIHDVELMYGTNFRIVDDWLRDTIQTDENIEITLAYKPVEKGEIVDTLIFKNCNYELKVPLLSEGLGRNLIMMNNPYDFGQVCIGELKESPEIELFRNDDPVPLIVNNIRIINAQSPFNIISDVSDTTIPSGGIYKAKIAFIPSEIGNVTNSLGIYYADQNILVDTTEVTGEGIGSEIEYSHDRLLFIPEFPQRELKITNTGDVTVTINDAYSDPEFYVVNDYSTTIKPGEEGYIIVSQVKMSNEPVELQVDAEPCLLQKSVILDNYVGESLVQIPEVITKPTDEVAIPINFTNTSNGDYKGERDFYAEFRIYYKMFFPLEAESDFGDAEITRNDVEGNMRIIGVKSTGDFGNTGEAVRVIGVPGLTDVFEADIILDDYLNWGSTVNNSYKNGKLIIQDDFLKKIIKESQSIEIGTIMPNPADEKFEVEFYSLANSYAVIEIVNSAGDVVLKTESMEIKKGKNSCILNTSEISAGTYRLMIKSEGFFASQTIIIAR